MTALHCEKLPEDKAPFALECVLLFSRKFSAHYTRITAMLRGGCAFRAAKRFSRSLLYTTKKLSRGEFDEHPCQVEKDVPKNHQSRGWSLRPLRQSHSCAAGAGHAAAGTVRATEPQS